MDWNNPMAVFGFDEEPQSNDGEVYDDNDDFYGDANPDEGGAQQRAGAQSSSNHLEQTQTINSTPQPISSEEKLQNQKKAEMLRAKLLAQRQNTPSKVASRSGTPTQMNPQPNGTGAPTSAPAVTAQHHPQINTAIEKEEVKPMTNKMQPSSDAIGLEALLTEGKALADAKLAALAANAATATASPSTNALATSTGEANHQKKVPAQETNAAQEPAKQADEQPKRPSNLSHAYYADLPAWLEMTGYHDVDFRTSKLSTYKERRALEQEAARIAERLEKLKQAEQEAMHSLRMHTLMATPATNMAPPPLPANMPTEKATPKVNGVKRAHSPSSLPSEKMRRREDTGGFRIRGANDSPTDSRPPPFRRPRTPSPSGLERRISYPDARRRSVDKPPSRDASFYRRDGDASFYDSYTPREPPRLGYNNTKRNNSLSKGPQYRGSVSLDLRKGGVRYFMIKSWNHENVLAAQRDNVWATQEKNEQLLTDAYKSSRHVILLFSVNKSMAFQGYALMTSAPDPKLSKPNHLSRLNWKTSPAFTLRWLSTTPIHFKLIGHLKNTFNIDDKGEARAVLVGKDGQEVSADAGMGVVWALDEAEVVEKERDGGW